jgi:hypothetical protein
VCLAHVGHLLGVGGREGDSTAPALRVLEDNHAGYREVVVEGVDRADDVWDVQLSGAGVVWQRVEGKPSER